VISTSIVRVQKIVQIAAQALFCCSFDARKQLEFSPVAVLSSDG